MRKYTYIALFLSLLFFLASFATLGDYGVSWDETIHFRRGQAYLHYYLTGETNYDSLPSPNLQGTGGKPENLGTKRRSIYQNDFHNGDFWFERDGGHPPVNGQLAALSNYIFFQKLGVLDDVSSHHLFNIAVSSLLVFVVISFASGSFGVFAGIISFLSLVFYPLFWAESHFNIKDPALTAFFALTIWTFYKSLNLKSYKWLFASYLSFFFALGTKFNALFIPVILIAYIVFRYRSEKIDIKKLVRNVSSKYLLTLILGPLVVVILFIVSWPYLWANPLGNFLNIVDYYTKIGVGSSYQPEQFFVLGFNTYPSVWILITTPPIVLVLTIFGSISAWKKRRLYNGVSILLLLWFAIPIIRTSLPGTVIYGGSRQIMEFLPAMVLLSGLGAVQIAEWLRSEKAVKYALIALFAWPLFIIVKLHPYQNVYVNSIIGGLSGAKERNIPSWGNTLGSVYLKGLEWINDNAEPGAKLTLIQGTASNAPPLFLREDIEYLVDGEIDSSETYFSGINRDGEYIMEMIFDNSSTDFYYVWEYVENFLEPVYQIEVDGVTILKIWKNDLKHTRDEYKLSEKLLDEYFELNSSAEAIEIDLNNVVTLSHLEAEFANPKCIPSGAIYTSRGAGSWLKELDGFPQFQMNRRTNVVDSKLSYYFSGKIADKIRIELNDQSTCLQSDINVDVYVLE